MLDDIKPPRPDNGSVSPIVPEPDDDPLLVSDTDTSSLLKPGNEKEESKPLGAKKRRLKIPKIPGLRRWKQLSRKQRLASLAACGLLLIGGTVGALELFIKDPQAPKPVNITVKEPEPTTKLSPLTGLEVDIPLAELPVTAVMIENSPDARPQSGLRDAGVVFEAIAEGGITRFLTLYQEAKPSYIGPVRSVRPYYLDWLVGFDAAVAHAGGSAVALAQIRSQNIKDLDNAYNPSAYHRVSSRYAPHNLYTSRAELLKLHKSKGYNKSEFQGFARKKKEEPAKKPTATTIEMNISSFNYNSSFKYNKKSNSYRREMAGKPHVDEKSGKQINPKVVIALVADHSYSGIYSVYDNLGSGTVLAFQDGIVTKGTWHKKSRKAALSFKTKAGEPLELNPGRTWITVVDNPNEVKY